MNTPGSSSTPRLWSRASRRSTRQAQAGFTLIEMLMSGLILSVLMIGLGTLLLVHWSSYNHVMWQNRVDMEARQALDQICDDIRYSAAGGDEFNGNLSLSYLAGSTNVMLAANDPGGTAYTYYVNTDSAGVSTLVRSYNNNLQAIATYITGVTFEYEYRGASAGGAWDFYRTANPGNGSSYDPTPNAPARITTIYVTVTASTGASSVTGQKPTGIYKDSGNEVFSRTLTAAVHMRQPVNYDIPRSVL